MAKRPLHGSDDVAALAKGAQLLLEPAVELPPAAAEVLGEAKRLELLEPARTKRVLKGVGMSGRDDAAEAAVAD